LVDAAEIAGAQFGLNKLQESARAVESLPNACGRQARPITREIDVESRIKILPQGACDRRIRDGVKMHGDMAPSSVLAKDSGTEIPVGVTIAGEIAPVVIRTQRRGRQHGVVVANRVFQARRGCGVHRRASGGK
jgi:hypothetical protein